MTVSIEILLKFESGFHITNAESNFSDAANIVHRDALSSYTAGRVSDVKSKAVLRITEDVRDKRVLVLLDMDVGKYISRDEYNEYNIPEDARPRELLEAAKFLKKILKENPTHLLVTTEISVPTAQYDDEEIPEVLNLSIKSLQPLLATLLRREVHFCPSVTALAETLLNVGPTAVILLDHTNAESMIPLPEPQESIESEDEEDVEIDIKRMKEVVLLERLNDMNEFLRGEI